MEGTIDVGVVFSGLSLLITGYFWLVKARKEHGRSPNRYDAHGCIMA